MRIITNEQLRMNKVFGVILALSLLIVHSALFIDNSFAQESSPSASPGASDKSTILDNLKKEIASKAAILKAEIDKKIGNRVYSGTISGFSIDTLTVDSALGSRSVKINEYTIFVDQSSQKTKKAFTVDSFKNGDSVIALGEVDEKQLMTAKKVLRVDQIKKAGFTYILGQISKVEARKITLRTKSGVEQVIGFSTNTPIKVDKQEGKLEDLTVTRNVIAVLPTKEASSSSFIYVLPTGGLKTLGAATQSASPSPTARKR